MIAPVAYKNLPSDVIKDFSAVVTLTYSAYMLRELAWQLANTGQEAFVGLDMGRILAARGSTR